MSEISDEMLMAYADGQLNDLDHLRVEAFVAGDSDAQKRLAAFTSTRSALAELFDQPMREPVPQRLIDTIMGDGNNAAKPIPLSTRRRPPVFSPSQWALAATVAGLLVGATGMNWMMQRTPSASDAPFGLVAAEGSDRFAADVLANVLETSRSGSMVAATISGTKATIKPVFTFATVSNQFCRQYLISQTETLAFDGVACRNANGRWRIEAHVPASVDQSAGDNNIVPAGKDSVAAIDAAVDRMISGDVLGAEAEAKVITNGWHGATP